MDSTHVGVYREMLRVDSTYPLPASLNSVHNRVEYYMRGYGPREFTATTYAMILMTWESRHPDDVPSADSIHPAADLHERAKDVGRRRPVEIESVPSLVTEDAAVDEESEEGSGPVSVWSGVENGATVVVTKPGKPPVEGRFMGLNSDNGKVLVRLENMITGARQFLESEVSLAEASAVS